MVTSGAAASAQASHRGVKLLKSAKNNFTSVCYNVIPPNSISNFYHSCFRQIYDVHIKNLSVKLLKVNGMISQFDDFFKF